MANKFIKGSQVYASEQSKITNNILKVINGETILCDNLLQYHSITQRYISLYKKAYTRSPLARRKKTMPIDGKTSSSLQLTKDRILIFLLFLFAAVKKTENVFKETKKI